MSKTDALRGAYCPLIVPFRDENIDYDTYGKLIERQIAEGTHGLLVNATSGEPTMLTLEERAQLVEFVIKTSAGRRPVCAGTASESFDENASLVDRFDKAGADSIFANLGVRTKRPLLIYHIPARARALPSRSTRWPPSKTGCRILAASRTPIPILASSPARWHSNGRRLSSFYFAGNRNVAHSVCQCDIELLLHGPRRRGADQGDCRGVRSRYRHHARRPGRLVESLVRPI
jgi:Dihydrodipicolinate synthetase family